MANFDARLGYNEGMELDPAACYRALKTRDARFDGRFFTAVRSTGVFCRPVCPAPTPKRENCQFFACAAAAHEAGFRPCLRCRPETSPGTPAWLGTSASVSRALRLIGEGALDDGSVDELAQRLGLGERHLRRLFMQHLGASPLAVAQTRRMLFAKKLIDETRLPMAQVALSSGFSSIRRFNAALRKTYQRAPRELRKEKQSGAGAQTGRSEITLKLPFRPPLDWEALADYFSARATPGVEAMKDGSYARTVRIDSARGWIEVRPIEGQNHLQARILLSDTSKLIQVSERLRRIFDLGADPEEINAHLGRDRRLARLVQARPGLRVPGAWDGFELGVRAILGQQISVRAATALAGRVAALYGEPLGELENGPVHILFPEPAALVDADPGKLRIPGARARAIASLARAILEQKVQLDGSRELEETVSRLSELPGIGEWTAQYIAMRALREPDAFPAADLGLRDALANRSGRLPTREVLRLAESWRPWRAYAALHLWNKPKPKRRKGHAA